MPGSPPRMRGKRILQMSVDAFYGITPADAGKTEVPPSFMVASKDHPRGCGENYMIECTTVGMKGSPPRMRGKRCYHSRDV